MKALARLFLAGLLPALLTCLAGQAVHAQGAAVSAAAPVDYRLGAGDVIRICVFQNPDLTLENRVTEAGLVSYPLLGSVHLGGLSVTAAEKLIADGLRDGNFVRQPQVTLVLLQVRGNQASVLGQVNRPGRYPIEVTDMRLSDLLASAGGTAPGGADTVVVTGTRNGQPYRLEVGRYLRVVARPEPENAVLEIVQAIYDKPVLQALRLHCAAYVHGHRVGGTNPSLVEALGAGNAIVAHDNHRWVVGEGGQFFGGADDLVAVFDTLLAEPTTLAAMREASRPRFQAAFTWPAILRDFELLLEREGARSI